MKIAVVGTGYVGLVTGTCLSDLGNLVICLDIDHAKIDQLNAGKVPIYEPGLGELITKNVAAGRLSFTTDTLKPLQQADIIFIAVGTPPGNNGQADVSNVENVAKTIGIALKSRNQKPHQLTAIINKSTVPVGMGNVVKKILVDQGVPTTDFGVVSNPEFLREGSAVQDFFNPDRIVLGSENPKAVEIVKRLYLSLKDINIPVLETNLETAELIKYSSNAFLATKISFINEMANICDRVGADVLKVAEGMGLDNRIGPQFLQPGPGFGGSCFPKDTDALVSIADEVGYDLKIIKAVRQVNGSHKEAVVSKALTLLGDSNPGKVAVLGLAFKANTDDMREAASIPIIKGLLEKNHPVSVFDPIAMDNAKTIFNSEVRYAENEYDALQGASLALILTEWHEFRVLEFNRVKELMSKPVILDTRNLYDPAQMKSLGFTYQGMGRR